MIHTVVKIRGIMDKSYKQLMAYSFNFFISLFGLPLIIISNLVLWQIIYSQNTAMEMTFGQIITYQVLAYIVLSFVYMRSTANTISNDIVDGRIVTYQVSPMTYLFYRFFSDFTSFTVYGAYSLVLFVIASFFVNFELSPSFIMILAGIISCLLAFVISFLIMFSIGSISLWWEHSQGLFHIYSTFSTFLAGAWIPIDLFPAAIKEVSAYLPFQYIVYVPTKIFMGMFSAGQTLASIFIQIVWVFVLLALAKIIWKKGIIQFTGYGT